MISAGAVDSKIELILMVRVVGGPRIVVRLRRQIGRSWESREEHLSDRVKRNIDYVIRKLRPHGNAIYHCRGGRIEDVRDVREYSLPLRHCRNGGDDGISN